MKTNTLFLDTAYIYALFNKRDQWHEQAAAWERKLAVEKRPLLTTEFVLIEIADGLAALRFRRKAAQIIRSLRENSFVKIIPAASDLLGKFKL